MINASHTVSFERLTSAFKTPFLQTKVAANSVNSIPYTKFSCKPWKIDLSKMNLPTEVKARKVINAGDPCLSAIFQLPSQ